MNTTYMLATGRRRAAIPILRDPLTVADEISAEVHRVPTVVRRRAPAEIRDRAEVQLRVALHALGLSLEEIDREADRMLAMAEGR